MAGKFPYDVFLSHSSKDKAIVRPIAERLKADGVSVWFDEWEIRPGDHIPAKIDEGLENSGILVLCMSANAFGSDWAQMEAGVYRFRDPLNKERRLIPLRLDEAPIKDALAPFAYIDWAKNPGDDKGYAKLLEACRPSSKAEKAAKEEIRRQFEVRIRSLGHTDAIQSVAFSPDGKRALSGSWDNTLRVWEVRSGKCERVLEGHTDSVWSVAWSVDGKRALSGSSDKTLRVWEVGSWKCERVLEGHTSSVLSVAWSMDGKQALSGSDDKTLRVWEVGSWKCKRVLEGHTNSVLSVAWSGDGKQALSGSDDKTLRVWEVESGTCERVLEGHRRGVSSVVWSRDGKRALSGSNDNTLRVWEVESGKCERVLEGHMDRVTSVVWSGDGKRALSGSWDKTLRFWEVASGKCVRVLEGHEHRILSVAWSDYSQRALSGSFDNTLRVWEVGSGKCERALDGHAAGITSVAWSEDGQRTLSGSFDNTLRVWEVGSGKCERALEGHTESIQSVAFSPDGQRALSGSFDNTLRVWEVGSGKCERVLEGHTGSIPSVAFSPDGQRALSGSFDNTLRVWEVGSGKCERVLEGHMNNVWSVAWSADGKWVLSGSDDNTLRVWEVGSGKCERVLKGHTASVVSVAWSADGKWVLSGSDDNTLRVWEVGSGKCERVLEGHTDVVRSVAWSGDGKRALSGSGDKTVRVWEMGSGKCERVLEGHTASVLSVAWSVDGRLIYSAADNGIWLEWDVELVWNRGVAPDPAKLQTKALAGVQYTNAKVLLVGESGAGKTGLSRRLALNHWQPSDSTVGAWATQWKLPVLPENDVEREIWLWDFGGQADQRLIHQLYMDETALALLVFDGQKEDVLEKLAQWDRDLSRALRQKSSKLLVAGRVDAGGLRTNRAELDRFIQEHGFSGLIETSAKFGTGCQDLQQAILQAIDWDAIPCRTTEVLFKRLKEEIIRLKDAGRVLLRFNELRETLQLRLLGEFTRFTDEELHAVVSLLAGPGVVWELEFGSWILLQPEQINAYAQAVIQTLDSDQHKRGCVQEEMILKGNLVYQSTMPRLAGEDERFVLLAMHQTLIERGICFRQSTDQGNLLIFPSYYRQERLEQVAAPAVLVSYRFTGFLDEIYATLVVRLHHTTAFEQERLWRYAADFKTLTGWEAGIKLNRRGPGLGELEVYFDPKTGSSLLSVAGI